jgi:hypothetical protein
MLPAWHRRTDRTKQSRIGLRLLKCILEWFPTGLNHNRIPVAAVFVAGFLPAQEARMDGTSFVGRPWERVVAVIADGR